MDDKLPELTDPLAGDVLASSVDDRAIQSDLTEVAATVDECLKIVADTHDAILNDIQTCLGSCHGDVGLCHSCILGDISDYVNRAGLSTQQCGNKIIGAVNAAMADAWQGAAALGIPPPTPFQIEAAIAGEPIPDAVQPVSAIVTTEEGGGQVAVVPVDTISRVSGPTTIIGGVTVPVVATTGGVIDGTAVVLIPGTTAPMPEALIGCIPAVWTANDILAWLSTVYGGAINVISVPGFVNGGSAVVNGVLVYLPPRCPEPPPVTTGTGVTTGGTAGTGTTGTGTTGTGPGPTQPPAVPPAPVSAGTLPVEQTPDGTAVPPGIVAACGSAAAAVQAVYATFPTGYQVISIDWDHGLVYYSEPTDPATAHFRAIGPICQPQAPADGGATPCPPCPPTKPPATAGTLPPPPKLSDFCTPEAAGDILEQIASADTTVSDSLRDSIPQIFAQKFGLENPDNVGWTDYLSNPFNAAMSSLVGAIFKIPELVLASGDVQGAAFNNCITPAFTVAAIQSLFARPFGGWFGIVPPQITVSNDYYLNLICQYRLPSSAEADSLLSRGYITKTHWSFLVRANGDCEPWQQYLVDSRYTRIGIADAYRLWKLDQLTEDELKEAWQRQGIDIANERERWENTVQQYPGMADLIRMMVRDVGDPAVVQLLGLDEQFDQKWADSPDAPLKTWGKAHGVQDSVAKMYWRAHWQAPSPQQIFTWLQRLRVDDRDPDDPFIDIKVSEDDAKRLLQIADYVPGLVNRYIAAAYRPITRRDISRLWRVGAITDIADIRRAYRDLGHSAIAAERLARATELAERPAVAKLAGELSTTDVLTQYRNNLLTREEAEPLLTTAGLRPDQVQTSLNAVDVKRRSASRAIVVKSLRTRYFRGEFTDGEASQRLADAFMAPGQASDTVKLWSAERQAKERSPTIALLCKWYGQGQIDLAEYQKRVENLNYNATDALRIVESCNFDIQQRRQKEIEAALAKQQKLDQQRNRELAKAIREAKQAARALKLQHITTHKRVVQNKNGKVTTTVTDTITNKPDDNITSTDSRIDISGGAP